MIRFGSFSFGARGGMAFGRGAVAAAVAAVGDPFWKSVSFLFGFDGSLLNDGPKRVATTLVGTPDLRSDIAPVGTGSLYTAAAEKINLGSPAASGCDFGTGDFTIEGWFDLYNFNTYSYKSILGNFVNTDTGSWTLFVTSSPEAQLLFVTQGSLAAGPTTTRLEAGLHQFSISRNGDTVRIFVDGVMESKTTGFAAVNVQGTGNVMLGGSNGPTGDQFGGIIDEVRITKGVGRYDFDTPIPVGELFPRTGVRDGVPALFDVARNDVLSTTGYAAKGARYAVTEPRVVTAMRFSTDGPAPGRAYIVRLSGTTGLIEKVLWDSGDITLGNNAQVPVTDPVPLQVGVNYGFIFQRTDGSPVAMGGSVDSAPVDPNGFFTAFGYVRINQSTPITAGTTLLISTTFPYELDVTSEGVL